MNNIYYRISQSKARYHNRQVNVVDDNVEHRVIPRTYESFTNAHLIEIKNEINNIGEFQVGSTTVKRLVTGHNSFRNQRTGNVDIFDMTRQFINVGAQFSAEYNPDSNYDTTGSISYYNREAIVDEVRKRITRLGYDGLVTVERNEYEVYELMPIEQAFRQSYDAMYSYQDRKNENANP